MDVEELGKCCALERTLDHNHYSYNRPKGKFSINYLRAISSFLGFTFTEPEPGDDIQKIDATIRALDDPAWCIRPQIDFQAKTISGNHIENGFFKYELDTETLNFMRHSSCEHLLVILNILEEPEKWVEDCKDGLKLHEQMYWYNPKSNTSDYEGRTITLKIPVTNQITKYSLHRLMDIIGKGGEIGFEL